MKINIHKNLYKDWDNSGHFQVNVPSPYSEWSRSFSYGNYPLNNHIVAHSMAIGYATACMNIINKLNKHTAVIHMINSPLSVNRMRDKILKYVIDFFVLIGLIIISGAGILLLGLLMEIF